MNKYYINIKSVTYAMKGKDILISYGFKAYIKRNNDIRVKSGCGYSIIVDRDINEAVRILNENNVKFTDYGVVSGKR